jgi:hypothetical protein
MRALAVSTLLSLAACGGGGSKKTPDASPQPQVDAPATVDADNQVCSPVTPGTLDFTTFDATNMIAIWHGPITGLDTGDYDFQLQFYGGVESSLMGTFDLSMGNQANFKTCAICLLAVSKAVDANNNPVKSFFQKAGSITLTEDPLTNQHLVGTITDLKMQEVTIDWGNTYMSTPVAGGACGSVASLPIDHDKVPNAFTCTHDKYTDGTTCDCMCGLQDPDCFNGSNAIAGCTGSELCYQSACQTAPANDTCGTAVALTLGAPVTGTTIGAPNDYDAGLETMTCTHFAQKGSDVVYKVDLAANTAYQVALTGLDAGFDGSLSLVGPGAATVCDGTITTCVAGSDAGSEGGDEIFTYTPTAGGTYYVIVDSFYPPGYEAGAFTLAVTAM